MNFGDKLKQLRKNNNMTQDELAQKIFVTRSAISKWENNKGYPGIESLKLMSELFNISINELVGDEDLIKINIESNEKAILLRKQKKLLIIALSLSILLILVISFYFYSLKMISLGYDYYNTKVINNIKYSLNENGTYKVDGILHHKSLSEDENNVVLESEIDGVKVTEIGKYAFYEAHLKKITLSENIEIISYGAFYLSSVEELIFNDKLKQIDTYAFKYANYLKQIYFPKSLEVLGYGAFYNCNQLEAVIFNQDLQLIDTYCFFNCPRLNRVTFLGNTRIGYGAFLSCSSLNYVNIRHVTEIDTFAFSKTIIPTIYLSKELKSIENNVFLNCYNLQSIKYGGSSEQWNESFSDLELNNAKMTYDYNIYETVKFHYNYENAPNDGYYQIDDIEYGEKLKAPIIMPSRKEYFFVGWYKEKECINLWDFDMDTLPALITDINGKVIYQETVLYAKWVAVN